MNCKLFPSVCLGGAVRRGGRRPRPHCHWLTIRSFVLASAWRATCLSAPPHTGPGCAHLRQMMGKSRVMPTAAERGELMSALQAAPLRVRTAAQRKTRESDPQRRDPTPGPPAQSSKCHPQSIGCKRSRIHFLAFILELAGDYSLKKPELITHSIDGTCKWDNQRLNSVVGGRSLLNETEHLDAASKINNFSKLEAVS